MAETTTTTTTSGNRTVSRTVTNDRLGAAWVKGTGNKKNQWVKPKKPSGDVAWNDNTGWITKSAQAESYKYSLAMIESDAGLSSLFAEAWADMKAGREWNEPQFTVRLKNTDWYKLRNAAQRNFYVLENDPAERPQFDRQIAEKKAELATIAAGYGITLAPEELDKISRDSLRYGNNANQDSDTLSKYISYGNQTDQDISGSLFGRSGDLEDQIRNWAKDNGVTVSNSWVLDSVREAAQSGTFLAGKAKDSITAMAKQQYAHWADKLDGTNSLDFLATGMKNIVSDEMDIDFTTLGLDNKWVMSAMLAKDDKGMPIGGDAMRKSLYKTNEWADVKKNSNKIMDAGQSLLSRMGIM